MKHPPFCPNQNCEKHRLETIESDWYVKAGHYTSSVSETVQRYQCRFCRTRFSDQTFSLDYAVKKHLPYRYIFNQLTSAAGIRDIARDLKVSANAVLNRISRLSRQALAIHQKLQRQIHLDEDLAADGFESFTVSQYYPNNIHLLVGKHSQYLYAFDYAYLSRKGRMTDYQKRRNKELRKKEIHRGVSVTESFMNICNHIDILLETSSTGHTALYTDEKPQYARLVPRLDFFRPVTHVKINSGKPRTVRNELFPVNYLDRQIRKDNANHVRESVQFSRNVNNCMERMSVYSLYHNYLKPYRINGNDPRVHAEVAGIKREDIDTEMDSVFTERRFYSRMKMITPPVMKIWLKGFSTPGRPGLGYVPHYAWA